MSTISPTSSYMRAATPSLFVHRPRRGFTMVELMVVVVIVGVLAVAGITLLRKYVFSSKTVEAVSMIQSIRAAQERYRAETQVYLNVSQDITKYYPMQTPGQKLYAWDQPAGHAYARWRLLNPTVAGPVQFGYSTVAGGVKDDLPVPSVQNKPVWDEPVEPWYVIEAMANVDGDTTAAYFLAASFTGEIYSENEGE